MLTPITAFRFWPPEAFVHFVAFNFGQGLALGLANLAFGLKMRARPPEEIDTRVRETAAMLGLEPLLDRRPKALSGGQRQRVAGAVAHVDMPIESGPTLYLPHTQKYGPGYLAWRIPAFREYFEANYIQLPLAKGDMVFFNPALFHAAGNNVSA